MLLYCNILKQKVNFGASFDLQDFITIKFRIYNYNEVSLQDYRITFLLGKN